MGVPARVVSQRRHVDLDPIRSAVLGSIEDLDRQFTPGVVGVVETGQRGSVDIRTLEQSRAAAQDLGAGVAGELLERIVDVDDDRAGPIEGFSRGDDHRLLHGVQHALESPLLGLADRLGAGSVQQSDTDAVIGGEDSDVDMVSIAGHRGVDRTSDEASPRDIPGTELGQNRGQFRPPVRAGTSHDVLAGEIELLSREAIQELSHIPGVDEHVALTGKE